MARVPYVDAADVPDEHEHLLDSALQGEPLHVYRSIGNNPAVLAGMRAYLRSLWNESGLTDREREFVILATARAIDSRYEWHQHVNIARDVGIDDDRIAAVGDRDLARLDADERTLVEYATAVVDEAVDAVTHAAIAELYDDEEIVGIAATAGGYAALGALIRAFDLELESGASFHGWDPR
ncbi:carboxymuconolactone decarboxylase family protein [Halorubrum sp. JWXQ-INN 858]|uniref:carboxymuconolactone decarboxylase family protein n=1 Tax=Halorubrum sp. JWXQ-INN 858 TaxID=2690782 RepID=UPI0013584B25|nr:carboxymuconolactone decarboxylase family protein [Halorubrum sp. JWXQ-INN 858]MWV65022.1 carboxymuconolactone decarboxylase family protein [Halorubrum sp. JWXQ-INN 858]